MEVFVSVMCNPVDESAYLKVGNDASNILIYQYGFERDNEAKKWRKIKLSGKKTNGSWIVGSASTPLSHVPEKANEKGKVLVYTCEQVSGAWKCGCADVACLSPKWQLQEYMMSVLQTDQNNTTQSQETSSSVVDNEYLVVYGTTTGQLLLGQTITIIGRHFELGKEMRVHFGDTINTLATVVDSETLKFTVPKDLKPGVYKVWFTSKEKRSRNILFVITRAVTEPVTISSVSPALLTNRAEVTIRGEGFTPSGNTVHIGTTAFHNLPSKDGKTISFAIKPEKMDENDLPQEIRAYLPKEAIEYLLNMEEIPSNGSEYAIDVIVANGNGISNVFNVKFK
jgi:hypothetical protein